MIYKTTKYTCSIIHKMKNKIWLPFIRDELFNI